MKYITDLNIVCHFTFRKIFLMTPLKQRTEGEGKTKQIKKKEKKKKATSITFSDNFPSQHICILTYRCASALFSRCSFVLSNFNIFLTVTPVSFIIFDTIKKNLLKQAGCPSSLIQN